MRTPLKQRELEDAIADATREAVTALFRENAGQHFYYLSLITPGEGHAPFLSAWSREALASAAGGDAESVRLLKWSYADSPFYAYREELFDEVARLFAARPSMNSATSDDEWFAEVAWRVQGMERAVAQLDAEGLFGRGEERYAIVVNVEFMPPDYTNSARARWLNSPEVLVEWLAEAAEPEPESASGD